MSCLLVMTDRGSRGGEDELRRRPSLLPGARSASYVAERWRTLCAVSAGRQYAQHSEFPLPEGGC